MELSDWLVDKSALVRLSRAVLADRGQHRAPSVSDLLIAATAEIVGLTVLHIDKDFDLIREVTSQPTERLGLDDDESDSRH